MTDPTNSLRQLRWRRRREAEAEGRTVEIKIGRRFYWVSPEVAAEVEGMISPSPVPPPLAKGQGSMIYAENVVPEDGSRGGHYALEGSRIKRPE